MYACQQSGGSSGGGKEILCESCWGEQLLAVNAVRLNRDQGGRERSNDCLASFDF